MSPACDREREMKIETSVRVYQALNPEPGATGGAAQTHARRRAAPQPPPPPHPHPDAPMIMYLKMYSNWLILPALVPNGLAGLAGVPPASGS